MKLKRPPTMPATMGKIVNAIHPVVACNGVNMLETSRRNDGKTDWTMSLNDSRIESEGMTCISQVRLPAQQLPEHLQSNGKSICSIEKNEIVGINWNLDCDAHMLCASKQASECVLFERNKTATFAD